MICQYSDPLLQARALSVIPEDKLRYQAQLKYEQENSQPQDSIAQHDMDHYVIKELLHWFKSEFFKWVDAPPCDHCGHSQTKAIGRSGPNTAQEREGLASVVEVYQCSSCQQMTRFPRYNHASRLLETRRGRCGEWAQCFTLMCIAMGYKARFVNDWTDHVWTEVFIERRWQHADSCEATLDASQMYESGWGKKLNMIVAAGFDELVDVTRRYTKQFYTEEFQMRRRQLGVSEDFVAQCLTNMNYQLQFVMTPQTIQELNFMQTQEQEELKQTQRDAMDLIKEEELRGRQSGSKQWVESRGEGGSSSTEKKSMCITPPVGVDIKQLDSWSRDHPNLFQSESSSFSFLASARQFSEGDEPCARLTPNQTSQVGAVWYQKKLDISQLGSLYISFTFRTVGRGADGFAFVLQADSSSAIGEGGCGIGYQGIKNSVAIEFDTYCTYDRCNDPDGNHISIQTRYSEPNSAHHHYSLSCTKNLESDYGVMLNDGKIHHAKLVYDHSTKKMHVSVDGLWIIRDVQIDLNKVLNQSSCWMGFTAATGGLCQAHDILTFTTCSTTTVGESSRNRTEYVLYSAGNVAGIKKKLIEFNSSLLDPSTALSGVELSTLTNVMNCLDSVSHSFMWNDELHGIVFKILDTWPQAKHFPVLDLIRLCCHRYSTAMCDYYSQRNSFCSKLLLDKKAQPAANRMILYRLLCNALGSTELRLKVIMPEIRVITDNVLEEGSSWSLSASDKAPVREPFFAFVHNLVLMLSEIKEHEEDVLVQVLNAEISLLKQELGSSDLEDNNIHLMLRSLVHSLQIRPDEEAEEGSVIKFILISMDILELLTAIASNPKISSTTQQFAQKVSDLLQ